MSNPSTPPASYEDAYQELQTISRAIEQESVSVDILADKVKRAAFLIEYCQKKLRSTETEVNQIVKSLQTKLPDE